MPFEFATAPQIVFGRGSIDTLAPRVADLGRRALVVTGSDPSRTGILERLEEHGRRTRALDLAEHLATYPAWIVVSEPQWLDRRSIEQISRLSDVDVPVVVIASEPTPGLSGLRESLAPSDRRFTEPWFDDANVEPLKFTQMLEQVEVKAQVKGGGLKVNDHAATDDKASLTLSDAGPSGVIKLSLGKKKHVLLKPV